MSAMDYAAGPDIRWYLSLAITAIPSPLSIAALVGNNKIVDDLDDDDSDNGRCRVRASLDEAAARVLGLDLNLIADWRARIVVEPTISNREAP